MEKTSNYKKKGIAINKILYVWRIECSAHGELSLNAEEVESLVVVVSLDQHIVLAIWSERRHIPLQRDRNVVIVVLVVRVVLIVKGGTVPVNVNMNIFCVKCLGHDTVQVQGHRCAFLDWVGVS